MEQDFTELSVQVANAKDDVQKGEAQATSDEEVKLIYKSPRLFRKSLIFKTWKLFSNKEKSERNFDRPIREHLWWVMVMFVGFLLAFSITDNAWKKFQTNPTLTSLQMNQYQAQITYPMVSVCPLQAQDNRRISELIEKHGIRKNSRQEVREFLEAVPNFSYGADGLRSLLMSESSYTEVKNLAADDWRALAFHLSVSCADVFHSCQFKNKSVECCNEFLPVYSENGFCYAFNARVYGTSRDEVINKKLFTGEEFDELTLSIELKVPAKIYMNPTDEPMHFDQSPVFQTELETSVDITVSMLETKNDKSVEDLAIHQRKCIFRDEAKLKHFKSERYTYSGCMRDCRVDLALDICGCLPPFHPPNNCNSTFCGAGDLKCLKDMRITDFSECNDCELACDFTTFTVENIKTDNLPGDLTNLTEINIGLKLWPLLTFHREVRFGFVDFLGAFGSFMALFLSFSLLSAIEIILYILRFIALKLCPQRN